MKRRYLLLTVVILSLLVIPAYAKPKSRYRTRDQIISDFLALETAYSDLMTHEVIGQSVEERDLLLFKVGNASGRAVFIDASIHGNEHATTETLYYAVDWILSSTEGDAQRILQNNYVLFVPMVNIDGYGVSRYNAHNVDLNRNYETGWGKFNEYNRGDYPLSEPETQAIHSVFLTYNITWYLNLHTGDYRITPPWAYQEGVPEATVHQEIYDQYVALSQQRNVNTIPYSIRGNYAGGTARDEGYTSCTAYTYAVELTGTLQPSYSTITTSMVPKLITLTITVCQAHEDEIMTAADWEQFWTWFKQEPPGWYKNNWSQMLDNQLQKWKNQKGITEMTTENWEQFWQWLLHNPPAGEKPNRWTSTLERQFATWKDQHAFA